MLIKSAENPSHFYHLSSFSYQACSACLTQCKLHAKRAYIIRTITVTYGTLQKNKRSSVLNLPKQRQVCPSLFFQFNMRISVIYCTLSKSCKRVVSMLSPLASNSCGGSQLIPIWMKGQVSEACVGFCRWGGGGRVVGWITTFSHSTSTLSLHIIYQV